MSEVIDMPKRVTWTQRVIKLKVGGKGLVIGMRHYRTVTSRVSSKDFKFQYPGYSFSTAVNEGGNTFTLTRTA